MGWRSRSAKKHSNAIRTVSSARWRSHVLFELNRYRDALSDAAYVVAREPHNVAALRMRATCTLQLALTGKDKSLGDAERAVSEVLEREPTEPTARAYRGVIASRNGDPEAAIADLSYAIAHGVRWKDAYFFLAGARMQTGDFRAAFQDLNQMARLYGSAPLPSEFLWKRAQCYSNLGELDHAIADYTTVISRQPTEYRVYRDRADAYAMKNELRLALADCDQAVKLRPDEPEAYFRRSLVRWRKGDTTGAIADIDRMAQLQPRSCAPPICGAVMTLLAGQDIDRTLASLDRAIALEPNFTLSYALRTTFAARKQLGFRQLPTFYSQFAGSRWSSSSLVSKPSDLATNKSNRSSSSRGNTSARKTLRGPNGRP